MRVAALRPFVAGLLAAASVDAASGGGAAPRPTPAQVLEWAPAAAWARVDPRRLLVLELASGRRVAILLAPAFAPRHVAAIEALAGARWYDGLAITRVQDNYVTQWGDPTGAKPLPRAAGGPLPPEYDRAAAGLRLVALPYRDGFAPRTGMVEAFPVAAAGGRAWLAHCYGMVGVGRDDPPDTGTGGELYAVIGQAPRALDRNLALVGRVIDGMDALAALPRGTKPLGFYATAAERTGIVRGRLAAELPPAERPAFEVLRSDGPAYAAWVRARANRRDAFFVRPAGAIDLCNALPPVRAAVSAAPAP